jgi:predicted permease
MGLDKQSDAHDSQMARRKFELFYFEMVGSRSYLRFTRLTVFLIIGLMVVSLGLILGLFLLRSQPSDAVLVNVNITVPPATPYSSNTPIIRQPPPQSPPPGIKQPKYSMPVSPTPHMPGNNTNV